MSNESKPAEALTARSLLENEKHPLYKAFIKFCASGNNSPTKRQARKFLQKYPTYRTGKPA